MSTKLFRNVLLGLFLAAMLMTAAVAYGRYNAQGKEDDCCLRSEQSPNTELPWEALTTRWFKVVSL